MSESEGVHAITLTPIHLCRVDVPLCILCVFPAKNARGGMGTAWCSTCPKKLWTGTVIACTVGIFLNRYSIFVDASGILLDVSGVFTDSL